MAPGVVPYVHTALGREQHISWLKFSQWTKLNTRGHYLLRRRIDLNLGVIRIGRCVRAEYFSEPLRHYDVVGPTAQCGNCVSSNAIKATTRLPNKNRRDGIVVSRFDVEDRY